MRQRLSQRMKVTASLVRPVDCLAEIGCDHAYLSLYLVERGVVQRVIAMDVKPGPLSIARENIRIAGLSDRIETRLSDGARELVPGEAHTLLLAGMGGELMERILLESPAVVSACSQIVCQPQSKPANVRRTLREMGFYLDEEDMIEEDGKTYVMVSGIPGEEPVSSPLRQRLFDEFGPRLLESRHPVLFSWLLRQKEICGEVLAALPSARHLRREREMKERAELIEEALSFYEGM